MLEYSKQSQNAETPLEAPGLHKNMAANIHNHVLKMHISSLDKVNLAAQEEGKVQGANTC